MGLGRTNRQKAMACTGGGAQEWWTEFRVGKEAGNMRMLDQPQLGTVLSRIRMHTSLHKAKAVLPQHRLQSTSEMPMSPPVQHTRVLTCGCTYMLT